MEFEIATSTYEVRLPPDVQSRIVKTGWRAFQSVLDLTSSYDHTLVEPDLLSFKIDSGDHESVLADLERVISEYGRVHYIEGMMQRFRTTFEDDYINEGRCDIGFPLADVYGEKFRDFLSSELALIVRTLELEQMFTPETKVAVSRLLKQVLC